MSASRTHFDLSEFGALTAARRFFVEGTKKLGEAVEIGASDAHKITRVLRLKLGDCIEVTDSAGRCFVGRLDATGTVAQVTLVEELDSRRPDAVSVSIAQAIPKGRRMEFVLEKCTELGASAFLPFHCERSVGRDVGTEKLARWHRIARTAAQQSGRRDVPVVAAPEQFGAIAARFQHFDRVLFAWEAAPQASLAQQLRATLPPTGAILAIVGPEGGFTHAEAELAQQKGAVWISLGARILRTDTAAMVLLAVIGALTS